MDNLATVIYALLLLFLSGVFFGYWLNDTIAEAKRYRKYKEGSGGDL